MLCQPKGAKNVFDPIQTGGCDDYHFPVKLLVNRQSPVFEASGLRTTDHEFKYTAMRSKQDAPVDEQKTTPNHKL